MKKTEKMAKALTISGLLITLALPLAARAQADAWDCGDGELEGLGVSPAQDAEGYYDADLSWDCFPGDGICNTKVRTKLTDETGKLTFEAYDFKLVIHTELKPRSDGSFLAHVTATAQGPRDEGGGLTLSQNVSCARK